MAAAYLVVGWVLVQVADTIAPMMGLPDTAPRYVLFLLIILFPIALFLAWAFDIRPTDGEEAARESATKGFLPVGISVLVLGGFGLVLLRDDADVAREPTELVAVEAIATDDIAAPASLAVLPFTDLSPEGDIEVVPITENLEAYDLCLQAQQFEAIGSTENARHAVELLGRAVELDPIFAEVWGFLAQSLFRLPGWDQSLHTIPYHQRAITAAERSLELDPLNSRALSALVSVYFELHEWERADDLRRRAQSQIINFERDPSEPMGLGYLSSANDQAIDLAKRFPDQAFFNLLQALYLEAMEENEAAIEQFELAILKGYNGGAERNLASAYWGVGQTSMWTAVWSGEFLANDPELLPLLPHMRDLLLAELAERPRAALRFRATARELGFEVEDLVRPGPRLLGMRVPREVVVALGESEAVAKGFGSDYPKFWMWSQSLREFRQSEAFRDRVRDSGMLAYWQAHGWPDLCRAVGDDFECD